MNKSIIEKYVEKLTKQDIINYTKKQNIELSDQEINTIYEYIKTKYKDFINNKEQILNELKTKLTKKTYQKLEELLKIYQNKI